MNGEVLPPSLNRRSREQLRKIQMIYQMADTALNPRQSIRQILCRPLHGALSNDASLLDISGTVVDDDIEIVWSEHGRDSVEQTSSGELYGSKLLQRTVSGQLGGSIDYNWIEGGVVVTLRLKECHLAA